MKGSGIIGAYHTRGVAPLMSHALPLYLMAPRASLDGMTLADEVLSPFMPLSFRIWRAVRWS